MFTNSPPNSIGHITFPTTVWTHNGGKSIFEFQFGGISKRLEPFQFEMFRFYEEASHSAPFRIHSLLPAFAATDQFPLVFKDDPHLNVAGNEFLAESVADYLIAAELVTGPGLSDKQRTR